MKAEQGQNVQGSVMVVGGGIAGMQASLDLADSGFFVHLVEKSPAIGRAFLFPLPLYPSHLIETFYFTTGQ